MIASSVNFNLYKSFVAVYEQKNISRAAAQLEITQPTVTYNIKELERQLGTKLFHTHPRGVEPTKDAHELYKFVSEGMASIANGESAIREFNEGSFGTIRLCVPSGVWSKMFAECVSIFSNKYPNVKFEISDVRSGNVLSRLSQHSLDLVISSYYETNGSLASVSLREFKRVMAAGNDFASKHNLTTITARDLDRLPFVSLEFEKDLMAARVKSSALVTAIDERDIMALVAANVGLSAITAEEVDGVEGITTVNDELSLPDKVLRCIYNKDSVTKPSKAFIDVVCQVFGVESPFVEQPAQA